MTEIEDNPKQPSGVEWVNWYNGTVENNYMQKVNENI